MYSLYNLLIYILNCSITRVQCFELNLSPFPHLCVLSTWNTSLFTSCLGLSTICCLIPVQLWFLDNLGQHSVAEPELSFPGYSVSHLAATVWTGPGQDLAQSLWPVSISCRVSTHTNWHDWLQLLSAGDSRQFPIVGEGCASVWLCKLTTPSPLLWAHPGLDHMGIPWNLKSHIFPFFLSLCHIWVYKMLCT